MIHAYHKMMSAATMVAIVIIGSAGLPSKALAQAWVNATQSNQITLNVSPPRQGVQNESIRIGLEYTVQSDGTAGKAVVTYHNVDTGQDFVKTLDIPLTKGKHKAEAVWDPKETLPSGMYVIKVILSDADGKLLASYATDPAMVQTLIMVGGATRIVDSAAVMEGVKQFPVWRQELEALEAEAKTSGADTTRQHILIVVLKQVELWSKEHLQNKQWEILDINESYLKKAVAQAKSELIKLTIEPNALPRSPQVPHPKDRYTIRDGYFYTGDQPVFLSGPCVFNFTLTYLPVIRELGFNVIQISTGPSSIFPDSEEPTGAPRATDYNAKTKTGHIKEVLDKCAELGLKVDLGLTMHFMPGWVFQKWPDAKNASPNFMMPYDIEHPEVLKLIEKFYEIVMPQIAGHPALNSIWVTNEPGYMNPNDRNLAIFRPWLKDKYKTIESLNKAWGMELKSFEEITKAPTMDFKSGGLNTQGAYADWWWYTSERVTRHFKWMTELVHKYDSNLPVSAKLFNATFNPQFKPPMRTNEEPVFDMVQYLGYDGGSFPFSKPYKDFIRSLDPSKPMANLEYKFGWQRAKMDFWQEAMEGASDINWWCWHPKAAFSPVPSYARALHYAALDMLDIQRLMPEVMEFNKLPRGPMVFLYPDAVHPRLWEYFALNDAANRALTTMGYSCDYASEKRISQGRLDDYRMVIMPASDFIRDETYAKLTAFIEKGGIAVVIGAIPANDEMSRPRNASFFRPKGEVENLTVGDSKAVKFTVGKGTVYHLPEIPRESDGTGHLNKDAPRIIEAFLELATVGSLPKQQVVIRNIENRTIAYKNTKGEQIYLTYIASDWLDSEQVIEPKYNFKVKGCRDLITGQALDPKRITIPAVDVVLLEFTVAQ